MSSKLAEHIQRLNALFQLTQSGLRIGTKPGLGRALFTRKRIKKGQEVLLCPSLAVHDHARPSLLPNQCSVCYQMRESCEYCEAFPLKRAFLSKFDAASFSDTHMEKFPKLIGKLLLGTVADLREGHYTTVSITNCLFSPPITDPDQSIPDDVMEDYEKVKSWVLSVNIADIGQESVKEKEIAFFTPDWYLFALGVMNANSFSIRPWMRSDLTLRDLSPYYEELKEEIERERKEQQKEQGTSSSSSPSIHLSLGEEESTHTMDTSRDNVHISYSSPPSTSSSSYESSESNEGVLRQATALFSLPSFVNHSCKPNCDVEFVDGHLLRLVARRDILPESEILIRYYLPVNKQDDIALVDQEVEETENLNEEAKAKVAVLAEPNSVEEVSRAFSFLKAKYGIDCESNCVCGLITPKIQDDILENNAYSPKF